MFNNRQLMDSAQKRLSSAKLINSRSIKNQEEQYQMAE